MNNNNIYWRWNFKFKERWTKCIKKT